ncbi:hypothetical protein [Paractinoplanes brasiliensis]|uniref:Uncharacterized protein n=1 Tax=Paractinoplanes brasiliensis TaxID=52695 RepID=A0A4R6JTJ9_9ACTN|nr:hypothetical protein [Actinoplanes brasiliensis]TDO38035.1 hypothetical protein C8E87_1677 [Actinoplanes brasiliensis]GID31126.1 hypothetical protein Abr02nite_61090 [Actinoplanes brasiliensis]
MAGDDLTPSEAAILVVLMVEAREVLNTELRDRYGLDVRKPTRVKLERLHYVASRKSGRTTALQLDDKGWVRMQSDLNFKGGGALGAALTALHTQLRERIVERSGAANLTELFARTEMRAPSDLNARVLSAVQALAAKSGDWVSLRRLRPFFADVPREQLDEALRQLSDSGAVTIVPESNQRTLTAADHEAALRLGGQDNHLLAVGV